MRVLTLLGATLLQSHAVTLTLEHNGGDQTLDLGRLVVVLGLAVLLLAVGLLDDVLPHVVLLGQVEELADLGGALGTAHAGHVAVGQPGNVDISFLDDHEGKYGHVAIHDAPTDRLSSALSIATWPVARVALGEQESNASLGQHALLHGESLLVVAAGNADDVALPFVADGVDGDLGAHPLLVEDSDLVLVIDFNEFLSPRLREREVQLHDVLG